MFSRKLEGQKVQTTGKVLQIPVALADAVVQASAFVSNPLLDLITRIENGYFTEIKSKNRFITSINQPVPFCIALKSAQNMCQKKHKI